MTSGTRANPQACNPAPAAASDLDDEPAYRFAFIASTGHSGSTLLELLLGAQPNVLDVGEIHQLPIHLRRPDKVCGCGQPYRECPFWGALVEQYGGDLLAPDSSVRTFLRDDGLSSFLQYPALRDLLFGRIPRSGLERYCSENRRLLEATAARAADLRGRRPDVVLDSSKLFYRLWRLGHCHDLRPWTIHLVRDPRGFVASMIRRTAGPARKRIKAVRMSVRYVLENLLIEHILRQWPEGMALRLRYEDLVQDPPGTVQRLTQWLGLPFSAEAVERFREFTQHAVSGNEMRFRSDTIRLDTRWKQELPPWLQRLVLILTRPAARRYGYGPSHAPDPSA